jgi:hypothetical protein
MSVKTATNYKSSTLLSLSSLSEYTCKECNKAYVFETLYNNHLLKEHGVDRAARKQKQIDDDDDDDNVKNKNARRGSSGITYNKRKLRSSDAATRTITPSPLPTNPLEDKMITPVNVFVLEESHATWLKRGGGEFKGYDFLRRWTSASRKQYTDKQYAKETVQRYVMGDRAFRSMQEAEAARDARHQSQSVHMMPPSFGADYGHEYGTLAEYEALRAVILSSYNIKANDDKCRESTTKKIQATNNDNKVIENITPTTKETPDTRQSGGKRTGGNCVTNESLQAAINVAVKIVVQLLIR